jgi:hypothetical protein
MTAAAISLISVVATLATFGTICFVAWTTSHAKTIVARAQAEAQTKLIERFESGPELVEFLKSAEGRQFISEFQQMPKIEATDHILGGIRKAIVVGMLGIGFLAVAWFWPALGMIIPGFLLLSLAVGFSISSLISVRLARSWGLFPGARGDRLDEP